MRLRASSAPMHGVPTQPAYVALPCWCPGVYSGRPGSSDTEAPSQASLLKWVFWWDLGVWFMRGVCCSGIALDQSRIRKGRWSDVLAQESVQVPTLLWESGTGRSLFSGSLRLKGQIHSHFLKLVNKRSFPLVTHSAQFNVSPLFLRWLLSKRIVSPIFTVLVQQLKWLCVARGSYRLIQQTCAYKLCPYQFSCIINVDFYDEGTVSFLFFWPLPDQCYTRVKTGLFCVLRKLVS